MNKLIRTILSLTLLILFSHANNAQIKLPKLVSDGMVLQRNADVKIWGWASPGEKVSVEFMKNDYKDYRNR